MNCGSSLRGTEVLRTYNHTLESDASTGKVQRRIVCNGVQPTRLDVDAVGWTFVQFDGSSRRQLPWFNEWVVHDTDVESNTHAKKSDSE